MSTTQTLAARVQAPAEVQTPLWGNSAAASGDGGEAAERASGGAEGNGADKDGGEKDKGGEGAAPKTWRGVASFQARAFPATARLLYVGITQLCSCHAWFQVSDRNYCVTKNRLFTYRRSHVAEQWLLHDLAIWRTERATLLFPATANADLGVTVVT